MSADCSVEVFSSGEPLALHGDLRISEDLHGGSRLDLRCETEPAPPLAPGTAVRVRIQRVVLDRPESAAGFLLWIRQAGIVDDGAARRGFLEAVDPLGFCDRQSTFTTHPGGLPLLKLAERVVSRQPGNLPEMPPFAGPSGHVAPEWLLQCGESGRDFLLRHALLSGQLLYWSRERFACGTIGEGPVSSPDPIALEFGRDLQTVTAVTEPDLSAQRVLWCDPASREVNCVSVHGDGIGVGAAGPVLSGRIASAVRPSAAACSGELAWEGSGGHVVLETTCPALTPGGLVRAPGVGEVIALRVDHSLRAQGAYRNRAVCVPRERWGVGIPCPFPGGARLVQGEVSHNGDPQSQHRVRVTLSEDPERRPSPWIPVLAPAAGSGRGLFWLPEIGDVVLVLVGGESPESPVCLGCVRGRGQKASDEWRSDDNAWKVIAGRDGVRILMNDRDGSLRFENRQASLEISGSGEVRIAAKKFVAAAENEATIDAARVNLGL